MLELLSHLLGLHADCHAHPTLWQLAAGGITAWTAVRCYCSACLRGRFRRKR
jgi:hypothetical protein